MRTLPVTLVAVLALPALAHADRRLAGPTVASLSTGELRLTGDRVRPRAPSAQITDDHIARTAIPEAAPAAPVEQRPRLPAQLEAADVTAEMASQRDAIERCYLAHVRDAREAGQLDVLFEIGRDGRVRSVAAAAPALTPYSAATVTRCIRAVARTVQFPARRNDTTVVLPYLFQTTHAPDAGPQLSCWSARGCR
jgi:hypothetical protein